MKILMINSVCGIGSTGRICTDLATELKRQGHTVKIAYGRNSVPEQFEQYAVRIGSELDVRAHALQARLFDNSGFGSKRATKRFIKWIKEYDPDIIHLHNIHGYYINVEILFDYLKVCGKKIVWTLHDCWAFTGHCAHFDFARCDKWQKGCYACPQKGEYPASCLLDRSKKNYLKKKNLFTSVENMLMVTPSKWLNDLVQRSYLGCHPTVTINNGIDLGTFYPANRPKDNSKTVVLGVANVWDDRKGFKDYIKLADKLGDEFQVILVGVTQKQQEQLPENVMGVTRTNNVLELADIYRNADVFVNLTYEDNYPTVNLEARACGTPVITYNTGGSPESAGAEAIAVEQGDIESVCDKIKFGIKSQASCLMNFANMDKRITVQNYLNIYCDTDL